MSKILALLQVALLCQVALVGCSEEVERPPAAVPSAGLRQILPIAGFGSFDPAVEKTGEPYAQLRRTDDGIRPAVLGREDYSLQLPFESDGPVVVQARVALLPRGSQSSPAGATFSARSAQTQGGPQSLLWQASLEGTDSAAQNMEIVLPEHAQFLTLDVAFDGWSKPAAVEAAWLQPRLITYRDVDFELTKGLPPILLITLDTTRRDVLGAYGGPIPTPVLSELAENSVRLTNAHSVAFGTTPSHASLMTAKHAIQHGVYSNDSIVGPEHETLAEYLSAAGYETAAFVSGKPLARALGLAQGFDFFDDLMLMDTYSGLGSYSRVERRADRTIDRLLEWLAKDRVVPPFIWLHVFDAHQPYAPPPGWASDMSPEVRPFFEDERGLPIYLKRDQLTEVAPALLAEIDETAQRRYAEEVRFLDSQLGRVVEALRSSGTFEESVIAVVADHGENFMERGAAIAFRHPGLYSEVTNVPLILKLPGGQGAGRELNMLIGNLDVTPTIVEAANLPTSPAWTGRSFLPWIVGTAGGAMRDHLVLEAAHEMEIAVRTPEWLYRLALKDPRRLQKVGFAPDRRELLFDASRDPGQTRDVSQEHPEKLRELRRAADDFLALAGATDAATFDSPEHVEALRALGYVE